MSKDKLTQKQETFCLKYFELGNATEAAIQAGYSKKIARSIASENLTKPNISARIAELREKVENEAIASVTERKKILTEIARGRLSDFIEADRNGIDINIDSERLNTAALQAVDSRTEFDQDGAPTVITKIRLHSPAQAIDLLNKMDKLYTELPIVNDNRQYNIIVNDDSVRQTIQRLIDGERRQISAGNDSDPAAGSDN